MRRPGSKRLAGVALTVAAAVLVSVYAGRAGAQDWRSASREPVGLAPDPALHRGPIVQVYGARTWGWRGHFGSHTWIAVKPAAAEAYTVYEVIGWKLRWSDSALSVTQREPDARWYGNAPELLAEQRGAGAAGLIARIEKAVSEYPHAREYSAWPGPNSNTFTAWVTRAVPELKVDFPPTAIGKDYLADRVLDSAPSGSGFQFSLKGLLALTASGVEGLELSVLGLTFGINPFDPALKLPVVGRLGPLR